MNATRGRSDSVGPASSHVRNDSNGPTTQQRRGSIGPGSRRDQSSGPPPQRENGSMQSSSISSLQQEKQLKLRLEELFSDENLPYDGKLLLETNDTGGVPLTYLSERLGCTEELVIQCLRHHGREGLDFFEQQSNSLRRIPKLPKKLRLIAKETIEKQSPPTTEEILSRASQDQSTRNNTDARLGKIRRQVEYYFGQDNLPYDVITITEINKSGSFPWEYVINAPRLVAMGVSSDEVMAALKDSDFLRVIQSDEEIRVSLKKPLDENARQIAARTLQRAQERGIAKCGVTVAKQLEEEFQKSAKARPRPSRKGRRATNLD